MVIEICVGIITIAFVILTVFLVMTLRTTGQTLKKARHVLGKIDQELPESAKLLKNANDLTLDVKRKVDSLDFLFHPLAQLGKKSTGKLSKRSHRGSNKIDKVIGYVEDAVVLVKKFREK